MKKIINKKNKSEPWFKWLTRELNSYEAFQDFASGKNPEIVAEDLAERMGLVYDDMPTKERLKLYDEAYTALSKKRAEMRKAERFDLDKIAEDIDPEDFAQGGIARLGFKDGMTRRTFLKIMAALAAFPVVGKLTKLTRVAKGTAPLVTKTSEMPEHFPKLVEKILREGTVVDSQFVKKTGNVKTYRQPDRPESFNLT